MRPFRPFLVVLSLLAMSATALAQDGPPVPDAAAAVVAPAYVAPSVVVQPAAAPAPAPSFFVAAAPQIVTVSAPVLLALLTWLFALARSAIKSRIHNVTAAGILTRLNDLVEVNVRALAQTTVDDLKTAGAFNGAAQAKVKGDALTAIKSHLGQQGIDEITSVLGVGPVDAFLLAKIEAQVHALNAPSPAANITVNAPAVQS